MQLWTSDWSSGYVSGYRGDKKEAWEVVGHLVLSSEQNGNPYAGLRTQDGHWGPVGPVGTVGTVGRAVLSAYRQTGPCPLQFF